METAARYILSKAGYHPGTGSKRIVAMKVIITGATGTAGSEVLRQALADNDVTGSSRPCAAAA